MNHRRGYPSAEEAMRSKAFLTVPGAFLDLSCPCGEIHVTVPKDAPVPLPHSPRERRAPRDTGPAPAVRKLVLERDSHACVCCGVSIDGRPYSLQHRKRRSQGGDNSPSNLITVLGTGTTGCHERIDSRRDPHDEAKGYTVRSWQDPALVPVMVMSGAEAGMSLYPTEDGRWSAEAPEGAAA